VADRCKLVSTIYDYISGDAGGTQVFAAGSDQCIER
jgi:hypothetical protein